MFFLITSLVLQIANADVPLLERFAHLQSLDLGYSRLNPAQVGQLSSLPFLQHLSLVGLTPDGLMCVSSMRHLLSLRLWFLLEATVASLTVCMRALTSLHTLELQQMGYLDGRYEFVEENRDLTRLTLSGFGLLRGDAMRPIASLTHLKCLFLDGDLIDDESLTYLTALRQLTSLTLYSAPISDSGLKSIATLQHIRSMHLGYCQLVTDIGLRDHLPQLTNLTALSLAHMPSLSDSGLQGLSVLPHLHHLDLTGSFAYNSNTRKR